MSFAHKIYTFTISGAIGGLVASLLHHHSTVLDRLADTNLALASPERLLLLAVLGLMVGASIGFFPSFSEGRANFSFGGALRAGLRGALFGAIGGAMTLPVAEQLHRQLEGGVAGRVAAWMILGLAIGFAEGVQGGARRWRGLAGGALGGIAAGIALEGLLGLGEDSVFYSTSSIVALILVGLAIALGVATFVNLLSDAWLEGLPGSKVDGQLYHLSKFRAPEEAILGSAKKGTVYIWIPDADEHHAAISLHEQGAKLRDLSSKNSTTVNGSTISEHWLRDGEVIQVATSRFRYREKR